MGLFSRKTSYKKIIEDIVVNAFHTSLLDTPGLNDPPEEIGGYMLNNLEGLAAVFFLVERSFMVIPDSGKRERAKEYLAKIIFEDMRDEYSSSEMQSLVIPLIERRLNEYHGILDGSGESGEKIFRLGSRMVDNFIEEDVSPENKAKATTDLYRSLSVEPAKRLKALHEANEIGW